MANTCKKKTLKYKTESQVYKIKIKHYTRGNTAQAIPSSQMRCRKKNKKIRHLDKNKKITE